MYNVDEARGVCQDRSRWRSVVFAFPHGKKHEFMYLFMYVSSFARSAGQVIIASNNV